MKLHYCRFCLFLLVSLLPFSIIGITGCGQDDDNTVAEEVGTYTLVSITTLGLTFKAPETVSGKLILRNDESYNLEYAFLNQEKSVAAGQWNPAKNVFDDGSDAVPYTFDGITLRMTVSVNGEEVTFVWDKDQ